MITLTSYEELIDNIEMGLYEVLEIEANNLQLTIIQEKGNIITSLENETCRAVSMLSPKEFKSKDLKELNNYINKVWYYNQQQK